MEDVVLHPDDQVETKNLLERMVGQKPITVLIARMVIDKVIDHIGDQRQDLLPSSVPELMLDYVQRMGRAIAEPERRLADGSPIAPGWIEQSLKALALAAHQHNDAWHPQPFQQEQALSVLAKLAEQDGSFAALDTNSKRQSLLDYLEQRLNLLRRQGTDQDRGRGPYRLALDPLADDLAALAKRDELQASAGYSDPLAVLHQKKLQGWLDQLSGLSQRQDTSRMRGFLAALRDCYGQLLEQHEEANGQWAELLDRLADLAGIDPAQERLQEDRQLIRRWINDLRWSNPELRPKAIRELAAYAARYNKPPTELLQAVPSLATLMAKDSIRLADRIDAAMLLGRIGSADAAERLSALLRQPAAAVQVRQAAAGALGGITAASEDMEAWWRQLQALLEHDQLQNETNRQRIAALLPLLQGASRGLQRLAAQQLPDWQWGPSRPAGRPVPMLSLSCEQCDAQTVAISTELLQKAVWRLPLPDDLQLELVEIPAWHGLIGSPAAESGGEEGESQRRVQLQRFAMARMPINQAQWKAVAQLPRQERDLQLNPASHQDPDLPVETVSWLEVQEWCSRLNHYLQQMLGQNAAQLGLPSESQWEVACRAGGSTPFHFGATLEPGWANYNCTSSYGPGHKGACLNKPSPPGSYGLVNRWGLADMHGNVWEWCLDLWHRSAEEAPADGSAWLQANLTLEDEQERQRRLLRGGSWIDPPRNCRSARRTHPHPAVIYGSIGFRVCCLPREPHS